MDPFRVYVVFFRAKYDKCSPSNAYGETVVAGVYGSSQSALVAMDAMKANPLAYPGIYWVNDFRLQN